MVVTMWGPSVPRLNSPEKQLSRQGTVTLVGQLRIGFAGRYLFWTGNFRAVSGNWSVSEKASIHARPWGGFPMSWKSEQHIPQPFWP